MKTSQMRRNIRLKKKIKFELILIVVGLIIFFISMLSFIINACTIQNVVLAWVLFGVIMLACILFIWGIILFLLHNKEKIKNYLDEIINK